MFPKNHSKKFQYIRLGIASSVFVFLAIFHRMGFAKTTDWNVVASGNWNNSADWSNGVPGNGDTARISQGLGGPVTINTSVGSIDTLIVGTAGASGGFPPNTNGLLNIASTGSLTSTTSVIAQAANFPPSDSSTVLVSGSWDAGSLTLGQSSGASFASLVINGGVVTADQIVLGSVIGTKSQIFVNSGGLLQTNSIAGEITSRLSVNGTIVALSNAPNFISGVSLSTLGSAATIDTNGFDVGIQGGFSGNGGLTKQGAGTLTMNGANSYSGETVVAAGTLTAGAANVLSPASQIVVENHATLDLAGFPQSIAGLLDMNGGLVSLSGVSPGNVLTITGQLDGSGTFDFLTNLNAGTADVMHVQGTSSGSLIVDVTNQGSTANPVGDIELISTNDGVAEFSLTQGFITVAGLNYTLQKGTTPSTQNNWYLANSTVVNFTGGTSTDWLNSSNWTPPNVPTANDVAIINSGATAAALNGVGTAAKLYVGTSNYGLLTIGSNGVLTTNAAVIGNVPSSNTPLASSVTVDGIWNAGTLVVGNGAHSNAALTIQNGGQVTANQVMVAESPDTLSSVIAINADSTLATNTLSAGNGAAAAAGNFNGGTLRALGNQSNFITGFQSGTLTLQSGGVFIDSQGFNIGMHSGFSGSGNLVKQGTGTLNFSAANDYSGDTLIEQGTLQTGAANVLSPNSKVVVEGGTMLDLAGFSQTVKALDNKGLVSLRGTQPGTVLTIQQELTDPPSTFALLTNLSTLSADLIDVHGVSSGNYELDILNQGGPQLNPDAAVEVVATPDGIAQFSLANGPIESGLFVYRLQEGLAGVPGSGTNWYLVNVNHALSREGQAIMASAPGVVASAWFSRLDTLHKRMGELRAQRDCGGDVWIRNYDQRQSMHRHVVGESFRQDLHGVDLGIDQRWQSGASGQWWTGAFMGYGKVEQSFHAPIDVGGKSYYAGAYTTWFSEDAFYLDIVGRAQHFSNEYSSESLQGQHGKGDYEHWGYALSAEVGKRWQLSHGFYVEPEVQLAYTHLNDADYETHDGIHVRITDSNVLQTRASLLAGLVYGTERQFAEPYLKVGAVKQNSHGGKVRAGGERRRPNGDGTLVTAGAGMVYQFNPGMQVYVDYECGHSRRYNLPWQVNAGFRWVM